MKNLQKSNKAHRKKLVSWYGVSGFILEKKFISKF